MQPELSKAILHMCMIKSCKVNRQGHVIHSNFFCIDLTHVKIDTIVEVRVMLSTGDEKNNATVWLILVVKVMQ